MQREEMTDTTKVAGVQGSSHKSMYGQLLLTVVYASLAALLVVFIYDKFVYSSSSRIAVVDVLAILEKEDYGAIEAIKKGDQEAARLAAEKRAKRGRALERIIEQIAQERGLLIVQKQAVLGGDVMDLTSEVDNMLE